MENNEFINSTNRATQNDLAAHPPAQVMDVVQQQTVLNPDHNENNAQTKVNYI